MGMGFGMIFSTTTVLIKLHAKREDAGSFNLSLNIFPKDLGTILN